MHCARSGQEKFQREATIWVECKFKFVNYCSPVSVKPCDYFHSQ